MDKSVHLSWPSHENALTTLFCSYRLNSTFCDVTICCNGVYFPAHRLILSTFSAYFKEILEMVPCKHPYIIVQDITVDDLKDLLDFIYSGEITIEKHRMESFFKAARDLGVKGADTKENFLLFNKPLDSGRSKVNVGLILKESNSSKFGEEDSTIYIQDTRTLFNKDFKTTFTNKFEDLGSCPEAFKICDLKIEKEEVETCSQNAIAEDLFEPSTRNDPIKKEEVENWLHPDDIKIEVDDVFGDSRASGEETEVSEWNSASFDELNLSNTFKNSESCENSVSQAQINLVNSFIKHEVDEETHGSGSLNIASLENSVNAIKTENELHFITENFSETEEASLETSQMTTTFRSFKNDFSSCKSSEPQRHAREKPPEASHEEGPLHIGLSSAGIQQPPEASHEEGTLHIGLPSTGNTRDLRYKPPEASREEGTLPIGLPSTGNTRGLRYDDFIQRTSEEIQKTRREPMSKDTNDDGIFVCKLCSFVSNSQIDFRYHKNRHRRNSYHCSVCPYWANTKLNLIRHIKLHKSERKLECDSCSYVAANKYQLEDHLNVHNDEMPYKCDVCTYKSRRKSNLAIHIQKHGLEKLSENKSSRNKRKVNLNLGDRSPSNGNRSVIVNHGDNKPRPILVIEDEHGLEKLSENKSSRNKRKVNILEGRSPSNENGNRSAIVNHGDNKPRPILVIEDEHGLEKLSENKSSRNKRKVNILEGRSPSNENGNRSVIVNHGDNKPRPILVIEDEHVIKKLKIFNRNNKYSGMSIEENPSKSIEVNKKFYQCQFCSYEAVKKCTIVRHALLIHDFIEDSLKKKSCIKTLENCDDSVEIKSISFDHDKIDDLNINNITDEIQKRFQCFLCPFSSSNETRLEKHRKRHVNKKFKCKLCPYQHNYRPYYLRHMKMHSKTDGFKYQCDKCLYRANSEHLIRYHQNVHSGEKPFRCDQCNFAAIDKGHLTQHTLRKH